MLWLATAAHACPDGLAPAGGGWCAGLEPRRWQVGGSWWTRVAPLGDGRYLATTSDRGALRVWIFDREGRRTEGPAPSGDRAPASLWPLADGAVVAVGALVDGRVGGDEVAVLDATTLRWTPRPPLPGELPVTTVRVERDGTVWAVGGFADGQPRPAAWRLVGDAWTRLPDLATGRAMPMVLPGPLVCGGVATVPWTTDTPAVPGCERWDGEGWVPADAPFEGQRRRYVPRPDGGAVVMATGLDGRVWTVEPDGAVHEVPAPPPCAWLLTATADRRLACMGERSELIRFDPATGGSTSVPVPLDQEEGVPQIVALGPGRELVIAASESFVVDGAAVAEVASNPFTGASPPVVVATPEGPVIYEVGVEHRWDGERFVTQTQSARWWPASAPMADRAPILVGVPGAPRRLAPRPTHVRVGVDGPAVELPADLTAPSAALLGDGSLLVVGIEGTGGLAAWRLADGDWAQAPAPASQGRGDLVPLAGGELLWLGGDGRRTVERSTPRGWKRLTQLPDRRDAALLAPSTGGLVVAGGTTDGEPSTAVLRLDSRGRTTELPPLPAGHAHGQLVELAVGVWLHVAPDGAVALFDPERRRWEGAAPLGGQTFVVSGGPDRVLVIGRRVEEYVVARAAR